MPNADHSDVEWLVTINEHAPLNLQYKERLITDIVKTLISILSKLNGLYVM